MIESRAHRGPLIGAALWLCSSLVQAEHYTVPLFVSSSLSGEAHGVLRVLNSGDASGSVEVHAIDDAGTRSGSATFTLNARSAVEFSASDLVSGSAMKGLSGGIGVATPRSLQGLAGASGVLARQAATAVYMPILCGLDHLERLIMRILRPTGFTTRISHPRPAPQRQDSGTMEIGSETISATAC